MTKQEPKFSHHSTSKRHSWSPLATARVRSTLACSGHHISNNGQQRTPEHVRSKSSGTLSHQSR